jgi:hypothetical protein
VSTYPPDSHASQPPTSTSCSSSSSSMRLYEHSPSR